MMLYAAVGAALSALAVAQSSYGASPSLVSNVTTTSYSPDATAPPNDGTSTCVPVEGNGASADSNGKYLISSEGIVAYFIPYGASLSNLFITDVHGVQRDIVLGFDNATYYSKSRLHPHLCGVPGRYANRIKNGTFTVDGETYHTNLNDNKGLDTLHGGANGWDYRNWTARQPPEA